MLILFLLLALTLPVAQAQCEFYFPKYIGGNNSDTFLYDIDYYPGSDLIAAAGYTNDCSIFNECSNSCGTSVGDYALIVVYNGAVNQWGRGTIHSCGPTYLDRIAFSSDGAYLITRRTSNNYLQIWTSSGTFVFDFQILFDDLTTGVSGRSMAMVREPNWTYTYYLMGIQSSSFGLVKVANILSKPTTTTLLITGSSSGMINFGIAFDPVSRSIYSLSCQQSATPYINYIAKSSIVDFTTTVIHEISNNADIFQMFQHYYYTTPTIDEIIIAINNQFSVMYLDLTMGSYIVVQPVGFDVPGFQALGFTYVGNFNILILFQSSSMTYLGNLQILNSGTGSNFTTQQVFPDLYAANKAVFVPGTPTYYATARTDTVGIQYNTEVFKQYSWKQGILLSSDTNCFNTKLQPAPVTYSITGYFMSGTVTQNSTSIFTIQGTQLNLFYIGSTVGISLVTPLLGNDEICDSTLAYMYPYQTTSVLSFTPMVATTQTISFVPFSVLTACNFTAPVSLTYTFASTPPLTIPSSNLSIIVLPANTPANFYSVTVSSTFNNVLYSSVIIGLNALPIDGPAFTQALLPQIFVTMNSVGNFYLPFYSDPAGLGVTVSTGVNGSFPLTLPSFITFSAHKYTISPTLFTQVGITPIIVELNDGVNMVTSASFLVIVLDFPPYFVTAPTAQTSKTNRIFTYTLPAMKDDEQNPIIVTFAPNTGWITYSSGVMTFDLQNTFTYVGINTIYITLSDSLIESIYNFTLTVTNTAPYFTQALVNQVTPINTPITYTIPSQVDDEQNIIHLSYTPTTLSFVTFANGVFTFTPVDTDYSCVGVHTITVVLTDSNRQNVYPFTITVINTAPFFVSTPLTSLVTQVNTPVSTTLPATDDNEGDPISMSYTPTTLSFVSYSSGTFTFSPVDTDYSCVGVHTITVVLTDGNKQNTYPFTITVTNTAPIFTNLPLVNQVTKINSPISYSLPPMHDNEGDPISLSYTPTNLTYVAFSSDVFTFTPLDTDFTCVGTKTITITLTDGNKQNTYSFTITVTNTAPFFTTSPLSDQSTKLNTPLSYTLPSMIDNENDPIFVSFTAPNTFNTTYSSGAITFTPLDTNFACVGINAIAITLSDTNMHNTYNFTLTVTNTAPYFASALVDQTTKINQPLHYALPSQVDNEQNLIRLSYTPTNLYFLSIASGTMTLLPSSSDYTCVGTFVVTIVLTDTQLSTTYSFSITVVNTAPYYAFAPLDQVASITGTVVYQFPPMIDDQGAAIFNSFSINSTLRSFITTNVAQNSITISPRPTTQLGNYSIVSQLCDGQPICNTYTLQIQVTLPAPRFSWQQPQDQQVSINSVLLYPLPQIADEPGVTNLSLAFHDLPSFINFDPTSQLLTIKPTENSQIGKSIIRGQISDAFVSIQFQFQVQVLNTAPYFIYLLKDQICYMDQPGTNYTLPPTKDNEKQAVSIFFNMGLPSFISFNKGTLFFSPTNKTSLQQSYSISIVLSDGNMKSAYLLNVTVLSFPQQEQQVEGYIINSRNSSNSTLMREFIAGINLKSITQTGEAVIQILAVQGSSQLINQINNYTLKLQINKKEEVNFTVLARSFNQSTLTISLSFPEPSQLSKYNVIF